MSLLRKNNPIRVCFYRSEGEQLRQFDLPPGYDWILWRPTLSELMPPGIARDLASFVGRWLLHQLHLFSNRDYRVMLIRRGAEVAHYSAITGRYRRLGVIDRDQDLQVGYVWTRPQDRGRRLASFALSRSIRILRRPGRRIWYLCRRDDVASRKLAESVGMSLIGHGIWQRPPGGLRLLGRYQLISEQPHEHPHQGLFVDPAWA
jgi:hypothetical protein